MKPLVPFLLLAALACHHAPRADSSGGARWVGTWEAPPQLVEERNLPPAPGLAGNTLRQLVHLSLGGRRVRVRLSNAFGDGPLAIDAARLAPSLGGGAIEPARSVALAFGGRPAVVLPAGADTLSDPVDLALPALADVAVTIRFGAVPHGVTGHPGSRTTSFLAQGDAVAAPTLPAATRVEHWYALSGIDVAVADDAAAVVTLGNSITDGRGSGTDRNDRWPDELARRLQRAPRTARVAVLNAGIGGNCVLRCGLGPPAMERLERDVLAQPGARWMIVLEGVNDIGNAQGPDGAARVADSLVAAYRAIVGRAHARGLRAYGATILPFGGSFYDAPGREVARQAVNRWIRESGVWDAVIDFDATMRDPRDPTRLRPEYDGGDHLHPNEAGYRAMAAAVDVGLFAGPGA